MADRGRRTPGRSFRRSRTSTLRWRWSRRCRGSTAGSCRRMRRTFLHCKLARSDTGSQRSRVDRGRRTPGTSRRCIPGPRRRRLRGNTVDPDRRRRCTCPPSHHRKRCTRTRSRSGYCRSRLHRRRRRTYRRWSRCRPCRPRNADRCSRTFSSPPSCRSIPCCRCHPRSKADLIHRIRRTGPMQGTDRLACTRYPSRGILERPCRSSPNRRHCQHSKVHRACRTPDKGRGRPSSVPCIGCRCSSFLRRRRNVYRLRPSMWRPRPCRCCRCSKAG